MISIIIGSLLGSCQMVKVKKINYILISKIDSKKENYLLLIYKKLAELGYCKNFNTNLNLIPKNKFYSCFRLLNSLNWIHEMFYPKVRKIIPKDLFKYFTPLSLAIWLIDDGTLIKNKGIKFSANNFTLKEIKLFSKLLIEKFNLKNSIVKTGVVNQYNIYIIKSSKGTLKEIVKPFIPTTRLNNWFL